jgi:uncharacterized small protein (DUF1192 family)
MATLTKDNKGYLMGRIANIAQSLTELEARIAFIRREIKQMERIVGDSMQEQQKR